MTQFNEQTNTIVKNIVKDHLETCPDCDGTGFHYLEKKQTVQEKCSYCHGIGHVELKQHFEKTLSNTPPQNVFLETLKEQSKKMHDHTEEIQTVLNEFFDAIHIYSNQKITAKIELFDMNDSANFFINVPYPIYKKGTYQTIMLENVQKTVLAFWNQDVKGYPCEIIQGTSTLICENKKVLTQVLVDIISNGFVIKILHDIMIETSERKNHG